MAELIDRTELLTREEAIKALNEYGTLFPSDKSEAIDMAIMAIEALEEPPRPIDPTIEVDLENEARKFQRRLARSIAKTGRWLMDNAEGIVGAVEEIRSLDIRLSWERSGNEIAPTINIDSDFICREAIDEMHRKENEK